MALIQVWDRETHEPYFVRDAVLADPALGAPFTTIQPGTTGTTTIDKSPTPRAKGKE